MRSRPRPRFRSSIPPRPAKTKFRFDTILFSVAVLELVASMNSRVRRRVGKPELAAVKALAAQAGAVRPDLIQWN